MSEDGDGPSTQENAPKIRPDIPLDHTLPSIDGSSGGPGLGGWITRAFQLGFVVMIAVGATLWWTHQPEEGSPPPSQRPSVGAIKKDLVVESVRGGGRVRPMLGDTDSMMVVVRSTPSGATLTVDGVERGETPAGLDTRCAPDTNVVIQLKARGYRRWRRDIPCQPGVEVTFEP
ncbi:MAG: PEGA domain-containing protein, partial [Myxococcota bacterium]